MNLKELSKNLGLSQTTVSRALNGYPEVSAATRKRVEQAAKEFNYHPSTRAKGLATGRALAIGHVIPVSTQHEMVNPVFGDFIAGAGETYSRNGYEMILSIVDDMNEEQIYRGLKSRRAVDGVIVHGPRIDDPRIALLTKLGLPFAVHGQVTRCDTPYTLLDVNNHEAFEQATKYLLDLGHRRIALVNGLESMDFAYRRRSGYEAALHACDIAIDPALMCSGEMTEVIGYENAQALLQTADAPTAFLCSSLISAMGVRRAIQECGLTMGKDVSVITHDDVLSYLQNGGDTPIFTATRSSVRTAGRRLAEVLLESIKNPSLPPQRVILECEFVVGQSTGPAPRKD
ncbi:LacI family DNA-binding transcriptional regulator [Loktanella sp. S4079]|uniref:LacI family DNA-binding transcriptional regulator n=1 Tax=Loktanella sp. S4079 TaxID=579483 RepID=UPI0005FA7DAD|nr:substrate-binding domain-containing protein [Loktanella sp. S4079]KJZ20022.1 LacI family transcriptional regulator [Loktanella sp. S4079]